MRGPRAHAHTKRTKLAGHTNTHLARQHVQVARAQRRAADEHVSRGADGRLVLSEACEDLAEVGVARAAAGQRCGARAREHPLRTPRGLAPLRRGRPRSGRPCVHLRGRGVGDRPGGGGLRLRLCLGASDGVGNHARDGGVERLGALGDAAAARGGGVRGVGGALFALGDHGVRNGLRDGILDGVGHDVRDGSREGLRHRPRHRVSDGVGDGARDGLLDARGVGQLNCLGVHRGLVDRLGHAVLDARLDGVRVL